MSLSIDNRRVFSSKAGRKLVLVVAAGLGLVIFGAFVAATSLLEDSLIRNAERNATEEAALIAEEGFAGAIADGRLTRTDLLAARSQITAARRTQHVRRVVVWAHGRRVIFGLRDASLRTVPTPHLPAAVRQVMKGGRPRADPDIGGSGVSGLEVAVPLRGAGRDMVADFQFPRSQVEDEIATAKVQLDVVTGVAAVLLFLVLWPATIWLARRLPTRADRRREAELARLELALGRQELVLYFQPTLSVDLQHLLGVEALIRWEHPQRGTLGPAAFLPLIEESHLADLFTATVIETAAETYAWLGESELELPVAVNISAAALTGGRLADHVAAALQRTGMPAEMLTLEITENALIGAPEAATGALAELRGRGIAVSLDDFGNGYSSLRRFGALPLDELKIDRSFVIAMETDERAAAVVRLIVALGLEMNLRVTGEGVETLAELERLASYGCQAVQGFMIAEPMPREELKQWLSAWRKGALGVSPCNCRL